MESRLTPDLIEKLSPSSKRAIRVAFAVANQLNHSVVDTEHLLIGLNEKRGGVTNSMLTAYGYGEPVPLFESLAGYQGWRYEKEPSIVPARLGDVELPGLSYSDNVHSVFETAGEISAGKGADVIRARHVLAGVLATEAAKATEWLKEVQFPVPAIAAFLVDLSEDINPSPDAFPARSPTPADDPVVGLAVVNFGDQDLLVTARQNLGVSVSDLATGDPVGETIRGMVTGSQVTAFAVAARETRLLIASGWNDGKVLLSDLLTGEQIKVMAVNPLSMAAVTGVMFAEVGEGLNVLCGRVDGRLGRWDVDSGVEVGDSFGTGPAITSLAGGRSGDRFLAVMGLNDGRLIRWDVASGKLLGEALAGHENGVMTVTVTNLDGRTRIISGGGDQTIRIWDMESGDSVGNIMRGQRGNITALAAIELDGAPLIISGSTDDTLRIWDLATQTGIGETIEGRVGEVSALAVGIVDGQPLVFSGGSKPEVGTWRLADLVPSSQVRSKVEWKNDSPSQVDLLRHQDLAGILGTRLRRIHNEHPQNSFLIHVDGPWGSGKSTLLGFLGRQLDSFWIEEEREDETQDEGRDTPGSSENAAGSGAHRRAANGEAREADWMVLWFDAWRQSGIGPPWWTLLASLREQMDWRLGLKDRIFLRIRETVFKIGLAGSSYLLAVIIMFLVLAVGLMLIDLEQVNADWLTDTAKAISAVFGALVILWTGARVASKFLLWDSAKGAVIFEQSTRDPMRIAAEHFSWLLGKVGKPVVFFIDDLDRCDEGNVVALLEAIQTLIRDVNLKQTRVKEGRGKPSPGHDGQQPNYGPHFVVAADGAWIRRSFAKNFQSFEGAVDEPGRPLGFLFLDKLFQLTVPMPYLSHELQQSYFDGLLGVQGEGAGADPDTEMGDIDEQVAAALEQVAVGSNDAEVMAVFEKAPIRVKQRIAGPVVRRLTDQEVETAREHELQKFAGLLDPNPRSMKRFLNAYSIMLSLQPLQLNPVSIDTLALWTILRLRWPVLADYLAEHPDSVSDVGNKEADLSGVPEHLHDLYRDAGLKKLVTFEQGGPLTPGAIESIR